MMINFPSPHPKAQARPSTPKVVRIKECASTPYSSIIFTLDLHLSLLRNLGACQELCFAPITFNPFPRSHTKIK